MDWYLILSILIALCAGVLPSLIWLFFWLKTDSKKPEPPCRILRAFALGTLSVPIAYFLEYFVNFLFLGNGNSPEDMIVRFPVITALTILVWALIEELLKYLSARKAALTSCDNDEPIDASIYLVTAALGFSALENVLFILQPIILGNYAEAFFTSNLRFMGATLLHVASSAVLGSLISLSFHKTRHIQKRAVFLGIILATGLHGLFNIFIIKNEEHMLFAFLAVWIVILFVIILFEKIKKQYRKTHDL